MDIPALVAVPSEGHLNSATNSPIKRLRKISCSSQVNNNYSNLDMESLEDMLRKVEKFHKKNVVLIVEISVYGVLIPTLHSFDLHYVLYKSNETTVRRK